MLATDIIRYPPSHKSLLSPYSIFAYVLVTLCASAKLSKYHENPPSEGKNKGKPDDVRIRNEILVSITHVVASATYGIYHKIDNFFAIGRLHRLAR
jgi:hypothetical protein